MALTRLTPSTPLIVAPTGLRRKKKQKALMEISAPAPSTVWTSGPKLAILITKQGGETYGRAAGARPVAAGDSPGGKSLEDPEQLFHPRGAKPSHRHRLSLGLLPAGHGAAAGGAGRGPGPDGHLRHPSPQRPRGPGPGADPARMPDSHRGDRRPRRDGLHGRRLLAGSLRPVHSGRLLPGRDGPSPVRQPRPDGRSRRLETIPLPAGWGGPVLRRAPAALCPDPGPHPGPHVPVRSGSSPGTTSCSTSPPTSAAGRPCRTPWAATWRAFGPSGTCL